MRQLTVPLSLIIALSTASAFDAVKEVQTSPVDLRAIGPIQKLMELPQPPTLNLGLQQMPQIETLQNLAIPTLPATPTSEIIQPQAQLQTGATTKAPAVKGSLDQFADSIGKSEAAGGTQTGQLSDAVFDKLLSIPQDQVLPHAENAAEIAREIEQPPEILRAHGIQATVAIYGSARTPSPEQAQALYKKTVEQYGRKPKTKEGKAALIAARQAVANSRYYELARRFGELVARGGQGKVAVVTGGGPGIMEGANRGAFEAGGPSVGLNIILPHEQQHNPYLSPGLSIDFEHFSSRKTNLRHGALAMVYFPGGFGTMDELFEVMTLMQTGKIAKRPIILVGEKSYWDKVLDFDQFAKMGYISPDDLKLFRYAETAEDAWKIVRGQSRPAVN
jgi:uncharacterized protein (TIGR00730 family)